MNDNKTLTEEELQRLVAFFEILIEIDQQSKEDSELVSD